MEKVEIKRIVEYFIDLEAGVYKCDYLGITT